MALDPQLRGAQGFPLTELQADGNWTLLAQNATTSQQGNVQLTDSTTTTSSVLGATATAVKSAKDTANVANAKSMTAQVLYSNASGSGTATINLSSAVNGFDLISVEFQSTSATNSFSSVVIFESQITFPKKYQGYTVDPGSTGQGDGVIFVFDSSTQVTVTIPASANNKGIVSVSGMRWE